jgi:hypothetical protein
VAETTGVLAEIKKLFVVETWKAIPVGSLSKADQKNLAGLRSDLEKYDRLITRNTAITQEVMTTLIKVHPEQVQFPSLAKEVNLADQPPKDISLAHEESNPKSALSAAVEGNKPSLSGKVKPSAVSPVLGHGLARMGEMERLPFLRGSWTNLLKNRAFTVSSVLQRENVSAFLQNHSMLQGQLKLYERQHVQIERSIHAYEWERVATSGVIPQALDGIKSSINLVNAQTIPGLNSILEEARLTVTKVNQSLGGVQDFFSSLLFKIAAGAFGVLVLGILIFGLVILIRMAFQAFP